MQSRHFIMAAPRRKTGARPGRGRRRPRRHGRPPPAVGRDEPLPPALRLGAALLPAVGDVSDAALSAALGGATTASGPPVLTTTIACVSAAAADASTHGRTVARSLAEQ